MVSFGYDITFDALHEHNGFLELDSIFIEELKQSHDELHNRLVAARAEPSALDDKAHSQLMRELMPHLETFISKLHGASDELKTLAERHEALAPFHVCKWSFIQTRAPKALTAEAAARVDGNALLSMLPIPGDNLEVLEFSFAKVITGWLEDEVKHKALLEIAARYAAWALYSDAGKTKHADGLLFSSLNNS